MVNILSFPRNFIADTWIQATWEEFVAVCDRLDAVKNDRPELEKAQCYYDMGWIRIETMGTGSGHGQDNTLLSQVVSLFGIIRNIRLKGFTNTSFRRVGVRECQPDLAFYIAEDIPDPFPPKTTELINVETYGAPTLAIEISLSTLSDDLGQKRLLYERLGVREYWVVDVQNAKIVAFAVKDGGSWEIRASQVLPELMMSAIEEALQQSQTLDDTEVNRWLMQQFQSLS
jgi:Uma2 family endonuclease